VTDYCSIDFFFLEPSDGLLAAARPYVISVFRSEVRCRRRSREQGGVRSGLLRLRGCREPRGATVPLWLPQVDSTPGYIPNTVLSFCLCLVPSLWFSCHPRLK
jgi:hypothetical protein